MNSIDELIKMTKVKDNYFGTAYNRFIEWLFNEHIKSHKIENFLNDWSESSKIVMLGDVYRKHPLLEYEFGNSYFKNNVSLNLFVIHKFENFHFLEKHKIFCDELMNVRKVLLRKEVNEELKNLCFVLGGIVVPDGVDLSKIKDLIPKQTNNEYKYKFFSYDYGMPDCLKSDRFGILFDFLIQNKIKIHFNAENYLFYSLVDIIDSIAHFGSKEESLLYKSVLYTYLIKSFEKTYQLLIKYEYPSIPLGSEKDFINELIYIFEESLLRDGTSNKVLSFYGHLLLDFLKTVVIDDLVLVQNNKPYVLEDSLIYNYLHTSAIFLWNGVAFDREKKIEKEFEKMDEKYSEIMNCKFVDSSENIGIQLSDAIVGFVARLLKYVNDNLSEDNNVVLEKIRSDKRMCNNIKKFYKIYTYSSNFYKYGICMKMSLFEKRMFDFLARDL